MNRKFSLLMIVALAFAWMLGACAPQPQAEASGNSTLAVAETAPTQAPAADPAADLAALEAQNLAIVQRFYDEFNAGRTEVILEVHAPTVVMHYAGEAGEENTQTLYEDLTAIKQANPDLRAEVKDMFAGGDLVVTELTWTSTQTGDYFGIPPTGKTSIHNGIVVRRMENGLIVESWEMWDDLAFLNSIGYLPDWDTIIANSPMGMEEPPEEAGVEPTEELLPEVNLENLYGLWRQPEPSDTSYNWFAFNPDGTFEGKHGPDFENGILVTSGTFTLNGDQLSLTFEETPQDLPCPDGEVYTVSFSSQTMIRFELFGGCNLQMLTESGAQWKHIVP